MTNRHFKTALTNLHMFHYDTFDSEPILGCPGRRACHGCPFDAGTDVDCYIQDRDKLTPKQLAYLHDHHPEFFL